MKENGENMIMAGLKMYIFDNEPYSLMFLSNETQNNMTTEEYRIGTTLPSITIHEQIISGDKGDINRKWLLIGNKSTVYVI